MASPYLRPLGVASLAIASVSLGFVAIFLLHGWWTSIGIATSMYLFSLTLEFSPEFTDLIRKRRWLAFGLAMIVLALGVAGGVAALLMSAGIKVVLLIAWVTVSASTMVFWKLLSSPKRLPAQLGSSPSRG